MKTTFVVFLRPGHRVLYIEHGAIWERFKTPQSVGVRKIASAEDYDTLVVSDILTHICLN